MLIKISAVTFFILVFASGTAANAQTTAGKQRVVKYETVATGFDFPEGPALSKDGRYLYCVNVHDANISRVDLKTGQVALDWVQLPAPGRGNGSTIGPDGALYVADVGRKLIARIDTITREVTTIVDKDDKGQPLLGPNDLICSGENIYFTDPDGSSAENPIGAVYVYSGRFNAIGKIAGNQAYPNGLAFRSVRDRSELCIDQSSKALVDEYSIAELFMAPHTAAGLAGSFVYRKSAQLPEDCLPDGMRSDRDGYLYVALFRAGEIVKLDSSGKIVRHYVLPAGSAPTNLCFSNDYKYFYVTETKTNSILRIAR